MNGTKTIACVFCDKGIDEDFDWNVKGRPVCNDCMIAVYAVMKENDFNFDPCPGMG